MRFNSDKEGYSLDKTMRVTPTRRNSHDKTMRFNSYKEGFSYLRLLVLDLDFVVHPVLLELFTVVLAQLALDDFLCYSP